MINIYSDIERDKSKLNQQVNSEFAIVSEVSGRGVKLRVEGEESIREVFYSTTVQCNVGDRVHIRYVSGEILVVGNLTNHESGGSGGGESGSVVESVRIPALADLNDYKTEGKYYCPLNVDVATMQNIPFPETAFSLIVLKNAGCTQIATTFQDTKEEMKIRNEYNGFWGAWISVITERNITSDLTTNGYLIPNGNAVYSFTTSNFIRDMKNLVSPDNLNDANFPYPYICSTSAGRLIGLTDDWYHIQYFKHQGNDGYGSQIAIPLNGSPKVLVRTSTGIGWKVWVDLTPTTTLETMQEEINILKDELAMFKSMFIQTLPE